jgi:hypothetical protein
VTRLTLFALSIPAMFWLGSITPVLAQATSSVKCSDGTVTVSTGNNSGTCVKTGTVINCGKNSENESGGGCDSNGKASCGNTAGSGSCTIAAKVAPPKKVKGSPAKPVSVGGAKPTDPPPKSKQPPIKPISVGGANTDNKNQSGGQSDTQRTGGGSKH